MSIRTLLGKAFTEKGKRGQLQIGVTMIIIFLFIVLLMFSLVLYFRFTYSELEETRSVLLDQRYSSLLSNIIGMPEFRCSRLGVESECLDAAKLADLKIVIDSNKFSYYDNLLGVDGIWVDVVGTTDGDNYFDEAQFEIYGSPNGIGKLYSVPVSLYYPDYKKHKIGILKIRGNT